MKKKLAYGIGIGLALGAAISLIVLLIVPLIVLYLGDQSASAVKTALAISSKATNADDVAIDGWVDDQRVRPGQTVTFWIAVHYPPATPPAKPLRISDVRILAMRYPNFGIPPAEKGCWTNAVLQCGEPSGSKLTDVARIVPQGGTRTFEGHLVAGPDLGRFGIAAVVGWKDAAGVEHRKPISIAPIAVARDWFQPTLRILKAAQSLIIPLVTFCFGVWLSSHNAKRDLRLKAAQENRAMVQQTWTLMLPTSHRINTMYYMPISHAAAQIYQLQRKIGPSRFAADECFYFLWRLHKMVADFIRKEGGWYLKNRRGEEIVAATWRVVRAWTDAFIAENTSDRAARFIREEAVSRFPEEQATFAYFTAHLARRAPFPDLRTWFDAALTRPDATNVMAIFELMEHVIDFEINRPYIYWYGGEDQMVKFDLEAFKTITEKITEREKSTPGTPYDESLVLLDAEIKAYHAEITKHAPA